MSFSDFAAKIEDPVAKHTGNRINYRWHSNPSNPDGYTFFDKIIIRPELEIAKAIIRKHVDSTDDSFYRAARLCDMHGLYTDSRGKEQTGDKPILIGGRAVENYCTDILVNDVSPADAYRDALNELHSFHGGSWRDADKDKREIEHKVTARYTADGSAPKKGDDGMHTEFELVCSNALDGLREATAGANRITGQQKLKGKFDDVKLPYLGYADYQGGGVELKTKWDKGAGTDKPAASSLPKEIMWGHLTQIAGYWHMTDVWPTIVYANRLGYRVFKPTLEQLQAGVAAIREACMRRERLLAAASTPEELLRLCDPQWDHMYVWRDLPPAVLEQAHKIWRS
jgi:hypothetical protein